MSVDLQAAQSAARYVVSRMLRKYPDAVDDILQDATLKAIRFADTFRGDCAYNSWFTRIAMNQALMFLRNRRTDRADGVESLDEFTSRLDGPEQIAERHQREDRVYAAIEMLTPCLRRAALRMLREELIDTNNEKSARFRVRAKLKELLNGE